MKDMTKGVKDLDADASNSFSSKAAKIKHKNDFFHKNLRVLKTCRIDINYHLYLMYCINIS